jgi:hypothetical protein
MTIRAERRTVDVHADRAYESAMSSLTAIAVYYIREARIG